MKAKSLLNKFSSRGFTLIELLIVIAILGILAAGILVAINPVQKINQANDARAKNGIGQIATAVQAYYTTNQAYPASIAVLVLSNELKTAPVAPTGYTYSYSVNGTSTDAQASVTLLAPKVSGTPVWCWRSATGITAEVATGACVP